VYTSWLKDRYSDCCNALCTLICHENTSVQVCELSYVISYWITVGAQVVNVIRYADDKAVVSNSQKSLQHLMDNLNRVTKDYGMRINVKKTKVMCISCKGITKMKIYIDGKCIDQVTQFRYLGSLITEDGYRYCEKEIRSRIGMTKKIFQDKKKLFIGKMNLELKKRIIIGLVWSVALYAAETWTLTQADRDRIEALEMWIWRRMEKISWMDSDKQGCLEESK